VAGILQKTGENAIKMGWARVNFNYFIDPKEADFVRRAIVQIASDGWKLLPFYHQNPLTGQYVHRSFKAHDSLRGLSELEFGVGSVRYRTPCQDRKAPTFDAVLFAATDIYSHGGCKGRREGAGGFMVESVTYSLVRDCACLAHRHPRLFASLTLACWAVLDLV